MESFLRIGLLILAAVILSLMLFESRSRRKPVRVIEDDVRDMHYIPETVTYYEPARVVQEPKFENVVTSRQPKQSMPVDSLLVISVLAKPNQSFVSYGLLQAISSAGMQFGEMNIFHYYLPTLQGKVTLFSLASATKPGVFDLNKMGGFSCAGLTLFMDMKNVPDPEQAFELMLSVAEQLADDLDGELRAGQKNPWNNETLNQYRSKVAAWAR
jgi:cell division protein ZipA